MNYIKLVREALRESLLRIPADADMKWDPSDDPELFDLYVLLVLTVGENCELWHVHDAWAIHADRKRPDHPDLVPFDRLRPGIEKYDEPFRDGIRQAAAALRGTR